MSSQKKTAWSTMLAGLLLTVAMNFWVWYENRKGPTGDANIGAGVIGLVGIALLVTGVILLLQSKKK